MQTIVLADLKAKNGFVNKNTVAGGLRFALSSRFSDDSCGNECPPASSIIAKHTRWLPGGYLSQAGHKVVYTRGEQVEGDIALVLTSVVDYKHERSWAEQARQNGLRVGFFGTPATHMPDCSKTQETLLFAASRKRLHQLADGESFERTGFEFSLDAWIRCRSRVGTWLEPTRIYKPGLIGLTQRCQC